jgi:hypothetical protein
LEKERSKLMMINEQAIYFRIYICERAITKFNLTEISAKILDIKIPAGCTKINLNAKDIAFRGLGLA